MILSLATAREERRKQEYRRSGKPWCGPCFEQYGETEELLPITLWDERGEPVRGLWCCACGEEFHQ